MGPLRASRDRIAPRVPGHGHPPGGARGSVGAEAELATPGAEPSGAWATREGYESTRQTGANTRKNIIFSPISPDFLGLNGRVRCQQESRYVCHPIRVF